MIYLYLKTHNTTNLKYLGKTIQDPYLYVGSGKRWLAHLEKHGYDINTEILFQSESPALIRLKGIEYSEKWDIVESINFANLKIEEGNGGDTSHCSAYKEGIKQRDLSGSNNPMYGRSAVVENNLRWYNNGMKNIYVTEGTAPENFNKGRIIDYKQPHTAETKEKLSKIFSKRCMSPEGEIFNSRKEAAAFCGVTSEAIGGRIKRGVSGWKYLD